MQKKHIPLVSVLIRSIGRPELSEAIKSVMAQTWPNIELLVINANASNHPDLDEFNSIKPRLINPSKALNRSEAANQLMSEASGEYCIFLDDDDWFAPNHLEKLVFALDGNESYVLAYTGVDCIEETGNSIRIYDESYDPTRLHSENYIPIHAALFRRSISNGSSQAQFDINLDLFEDWDFWLQCQTFGGFLYVPGISAFYRIHSGHGEGVNTKDEQRSISALYAIASKWQGRYSVSQFVDILVRARHLKSAQDKLTESQFLLDLDRAKLNDVSSENLTLKEERSTLISSNDALTKLNIIFSDKNDLLIKKNSDISVEVERFNLENGSLINQLAELKNRLNYLVEDNSKLGSENSKLGSENSKLVSENLRLINVDAELQDTISALDRKIEQLLLDISSSNVENTRLKNHIKSLDEYIHGVWVSRSWRITKSLRFIGRIIRRIRSVIFSFLHKVGMRLYRSKITSPIMDLIPSAMKRRVHNYLLVGCALPQHTVEVGQNVHSIVQEVEELPLVSVIIPVYNHAQYIERCIESALSQTWDNLEVIIVNDASTEPEVRQILDRIESHPRVKILHNPKNLGICGAQNNAIIESKGKIIAFLDCDDYLAQDAVEKCMAVWQDDTIYLHTGRINVDENNKEINRINFVELPRENYFSENLQAMYATHFKLIRRDAFAKVGLFDERFDSAQDYEMLMRVAFHYPSSSFLHLPDFVYFHRFHSGQTTEKQRAKQDNLTLTIQNEARLRAAIRCGDYKRFVSFIMLSYGKHSQTLRAIQGLEATVKIPHEIILYDNGSEAETVNFIKNEIDGKFSNVNVVYGDRNLGPAQGRRAAFEYATGEWFIVFDNDEVPEPGWIEELLLRAEANENVGAVCCRVAFPDATLQFSGGQVIDLGDDLIDLGLYDRGRRFDDLASCVFRKVDWCPIGATLFTKNIAKYLHEGYPNVFEDAGVSHALKKEGFQLLNAPGALVWHDHISFQPKVEMKETYMRDRYNPKLMLRSLSSFYLENGKIIHDEYVWRENKLHNLERNELIEILTNSDTVSIKF